MKQQIRFFAIGLLTASIIIFGFYLITDETEAVIEDAPAEELISKIESDGYRVITEDEFISYSFYLEEKYDEEDEDTDSKKKEKQSKKKEKNSSKKKANEKDDKSNDKKDNQKENDKDEAEPDDKEEVKKVKFKVEQGMVSQDIAEILVENNIIDDAQEFQDYLEDNDYSPYIQLGSFEVTSDMSLKQIAETITTYPGN